MDENNSEATEGVTTGDPVTSAADSATPEYVTADQLQTFQKSLMGDLRKTMAGMLKTQPAPTQGKPAEPAAAPAFDAKAEMRTYRETERALAKHGFNDDQSDIARSLMDSQTPDDVSAFVGELAKRMGISAPGSSAQPVTTAPNPNPSSDGGSPGMTPTIDSDDMPVWKWSEEKVEKFVKEKGMRAFAQEMKQRLKKDLHGQRFHFPRS